MDRLDAIEERLARIEEDITRVGDRLSDHIEPEKHATEEKPEEWPYPKATLKQVTRGWSKACQERDDFRDKIVAIEDIADGDGSPSERLNKIRAVIDVHACDKPSEFISLPRWVAERYIRYVEAKDAPEAIEYYRSRQDVIDVIKQQLG
jgi:hypothetical protein